MKQMKRSKLIGILISAFMLILSVSILAGCKPDEQSATPPAAEPTEYLITYAGLDGAINPNVVTSYTADSGEIALLDAKKEGYPFECWTYNGTPVTKIDGSWESDVTLVANWGAHDCHLELRWDLAEDMRFYYVGEPFTVNFYLFGQNIQVAPKVYLIHGEDLEETLIYYNFMFLSVDGFDSMTPGTKHVTVTLRGMPNPYGGYFNASTSYDVEVREPDAAEYGYEHIYVNDIEYRGTAVPVEFPDGYTLSAVVKNESRVWAYNWIGTGETDAHAESCSEKNYQPWDILRGTTATTNTLEVPSIAGFGDVERYRLLTIYEDMTRVYTPVITVGIVAPEKYGDYAFFDEYVFKKGETLDLEALGIGLGTITFDANGTEFTFDNVNYVSDTFKSDGIRCTPGFLYYHKEVGDYAIHLVGENYLTNVFEYQNAAGFTVNVQGERSDTESTLLIDGTGSLHIVGGDKGIYAPCELTVDTTITFSSYLDRAMTAIDAYAIRLTDNARIYATNVGSGLFTSLGGMLIDEGAVVDLRLTAPKPVKVISNYAQVNGLYATSNMLIYSDHVNVTLTVNSDMYGEFEGVAACGLIVSAQGNIWIEGAKIDLNLFTRSSSARANVAFDQANGIFAQEDICITGSDEKGATELKMNLQADLFNYVQAIGSGKDVVIDEKSVVDIYARSVTGFDGISAGDGKVTIDGGAQIDLDGFRMILDEDAFGIFATEFEIGDAALSVRLNNGFAMAIYLGVRQGVIDYDPAYVPTMTAGFGDDVFVGLLGVMAGPGESHTFETIYDLTDPEHPMVANAFAVDYTE